MCSKKSNNLKLEGTNISAFCEAVQNKDYLVRLLEFRYTRAAGSLLLCCEVDDTSVSLTKGYQNSLVNQVEEILNTIVLPLAELTKHNFSLFVKIDSHGQVVYSNIKIQFKINLNGELNSLHEKFHKPLRVFMPFIEYIDFIKLRGRNYKLSVIEAEVNIDSEDLIYFIENPVVGPKSTEQWYSFAIEADREAKLEFKIDLTIPIHEGSVTWEVPKKKIMQHYELINDVKALRL